MIRIMTEELKQSALAGNETAQKMWMSEELSEFYEAVDLWRCGKATFFDVGEEALGIFRTVQSFPCTETMMWPHLDALAEIICRWDFDRTAQYRWFKDKKTRKGQALDMTYENLFSYIDACLLRV